MALLIKWHIGLGFNDKKTCHKNFDSTFQSTDSLSNSISDHSLNETKANAKLSLNVEPNLSCRNARCEKISNCNAKREHLSSLQLKKLQCLHQAFADITSLTTIATNTTNTTLTLPGSSLVESESSSLQVTQ
jgi:hypothetical protein